MSKHWIDTPFCDASSERGSRTSSSVTRVPKNREPDDVVPYTRGEIVEIAACDEIGRSSYERRRARAMIALDAIRRFPYQRRVTLERNHVRGMYLAKRTIKNHRLIQVELPRVVLEALDVLPPPKS